MLNAPSLIASPMSTRDGTWIDPPDSLSMNIDTLETWEELCIDCFIRIEAIKADKEECEKDNSVKDIKLKAKEEEIVELKAEKKKQKVKSFANGLVTGIITTAVTGLIIFR